MTYYHALDLVHDPECECITADTGCMPCAAIEYHEADGCTRADCRDTTTMETIEIAAWKLTGGAFT